MVALPLIAGACQTHRPIVAPSAPIGTPTPYTADAAPAPQQSANTTRREGTWEVTLNAAGGNDEDFDAGLAQLVGSAGLFVSDELQVVGRQNIQFSDAGSGFPDVWNGSTRVAVDYHFFNDSAVVPFVGANLGYIYGDSIKETFAGAPEAGVKWYVKDDAFFQLMAEYQFFFDSDKRIGNTFDNGQFLYTLGIGLSF